MKPLSIAIGVLGLSWLVYFWLAVGTYPRAHLTIPHLNGVVAMTMLSAVACALPGKIVSRYWWFGLAAALATLLMLVSRVH